MAQENSLSRIQPDTDLEFYHGFTRFAAASMKLGEVGMKICKLITVGVGTYTIIDGAIRGDTDSVVAGSLIIGIGTPVAHGTQRLAEREQSYYSGEFQFATAELQRRSDALYDELVYGEAAPLVNPYLQENLIEE